MHTLDAASRERYVPPYATALVHAGLRDRDAAYAWLQRAYEAHDVHLALLVIDPKWTAFEPSRSSRTSSCGVASQRPPDTVSAASRRAGYERLPRRRRRPESGNGDADFGEVGARTSI